MKALLAALEPDWQLLVSQACQQAIPDSCVRAASGISLGFHSRASPDEASSRAQTPSTPCEQRDAWPVVFDPPTAPRHRGQ
jgi:hypothetical protein